MKQKEKYRPKSLIVKRTFKTDKRKRIRKEKMNKKNQVTRKITALG